MQHITYVVFMKNLVTGEHFAVPHNAPPAAHETAMEALRQRYPANKFMTLTAYTLEELEDTCEHVRRWPGVATKPQKETAHRVTTTAAHITSPTPSAEAVAAVEKFAATQGQATTPTTTAQQNTAQPVQNSSIFQPGSMLKQAQTQQAAPKTPTQPTSPDVQAGPAPAFREQAVTQHQQPTAPQGGLSVIQALKQMR